MKRILIIIVGVWALLPIIGYAQNINLTKLPKAQRDSVAIQIAIAAMKKYAPSYYHESLVPVVYESVVSNKQDANYGKIEYTVGFPFDYGKAIQEGRVGENVYGGAVYIVGETGKAISMFLTGWMSLFMIEETGTRSSRPKIAKPTTVPRKLFE